MPLLHRLPFWYSWNGFRGSQFVWGLFGNIWKNPDFNKIQLPNTFPIIVNKRDWISKTIYQGTYERSLLHFLDSLDLSDLVIDVGANVGVTLWHALKNSNPNTTYLAFEPSKQCLPGLLMATSRIQRNGHVLGHAIGDTNGIQTMHGMENEKHSGGASLISHSGQGGHSEDVEVRKLDSIFANYFEGRPVSLLKIDTEGYEGHVVDGARKLLESGLVEIIVMEVSPNFGDVSYLRRVNKLLGDSYHWFSLDESGSFKRKPCLRKISLEQSLNRSEQWNLVITQDDVLKSYLTQKHQIFLGGETSSKQ